MFDQTELLIDGNFAIYKVKIKLNNSLTIIK